MVSQTHASTNEIAGIGLVNRVRVDRDLKGGGAIADDVVDGQTRKRVEERAAELLHLRDGRARLTHSRGPDDGHEIGGGALAVDLRRLRGRVQRERVGVRAGRVLDATEAGFLTHALSVLLIGQVIRGRVVEIKRRKATCKSRHVLQTSRWGPKHKNI